MPFSKGNGVILENKVGSSQQIVEDSAEGAQVKMREYRLARYCAFVLGVGLTLAASGTLAEEPRGRIDVGLAVRYMPTGWFEWSGRTGATDSALGAYPALGGALFVDYRLNPALSIGFMPEFTLNVIPRTTYYPVSAMTAGSLRVKVEYPGARGWCQHFPVRRATAIDDQPSTRQGKTQRPRADGILLTKRPREPKEQTGTANRAEFRPPDEVPETSRAARSSST
jgi:hypothetical protein